MFYNSLILWGFFLSLFLKFFKVGFWSNILQLLIVKSIIFFPFMPSCYFAAKLRFFSSWEYKNIHVEFQVCLQFHFYIKFHMDLSLFGMIGGKAHQYFLSHSYQLFM